MKTPCDEAVMESGNVKAPCMAESRKWLLAATILASSMAFIDGTVVNVALPAIQANFGATLVGVQWVVATRGTSYIEPSWKRGLRPFLVGRNTGAKSLRI